jgi:hypothetical protein
VPTCASETPNSSSPSSNPHPNSSGLRRSNRTNLGKGSSRLDTRIHPGDYLASDEPIANSEHARSVKAVEAKDARDALPESKAVKDHLRSLIQQACTRALMDLESAEAKEYTSDDDTALLVTTKKDPSLDLGTNQKMNTFRVAEQRSMTSIYETNGITQPYAFKASNSDPDTLSYDEVMTDVDRELWIVAAKKEIKSLEDHGTWTEVDILEAMSISTQANS